MAIKSKEKTTAKKKVKQNFAEMSVAELKKAESDLRKQLFELRMKIKTASYPNVSQVQEAKRNIARILTSVKQKEAASKAGKAAG